MRTLTQLSVSALLTTTLLAGAANPLAAQGIRGKLLEDPTNRPISGASVSLVGAVSARVAATTKTGNDGGFSLQAPGPGIYRLTAALPGYRSAVTPAIELLPGDQVDVTLTMLSDTTRLRAITVNANSRENNNRLAGFAQRNAFGHYITRDQIDKMHPISITDLLRSWVRRSIRSSTRTTSTASRCTRTPRRCRRNMRAPPRPAARS
jgi:hypothetical protein